MRAAAPHSDTLNAFERLGLRMLRAYSDASRPAKRHWSSQVLEKVQRIERSTLIQAALSGAVSGALLAVGELGLVAWFGEDRGGGSLLDQWPFWSLYLGSALVVSAAEIAFLYWRILVEVARVGSLTGLDLDREETEKMMGLGLSRAALDLPNPRAAFHGVDPYARLPRWKLIAYAVLYRVKVGVTSVIVRTLLRRVLARTALRATVPFAAVAVYAVWNTLVTHWILREVRYRAAGPVAMRDLAELEDADAHDLDAGQRRQVAAVVAESVVRSQDAHPNYVLFYGGLLDRLEMEPDDIEHEGEDVLDGVGEWPLSAQRRLLRELTVATVLRGRPRRAQREWLESAATTCGRRLDPDGLASLAKRFREGRGVDAASLDAVTPGG